MSISKQKRIEKAFEEVLRELNPKFESDPDMMETPQRMSRYYMHFFRNDDPSVHLEKKFPTKSEQLVVVKDIECFGMCPHHLMPIIYKVNIGYKPKEWVLGLSKLPRIVTALASVPKLQENLTADIVDFLHNGLHSQGVIVTVSGVHGCMRCRGVEQNSSVVTIETRGGEMNTPGSKREFFELLKI
jgi:GTP cyclohydrolase I